MAKQTDFQVGKNIPIKPALDVIAKELGCKAVMPLNRIATTPRDIMEFYFLLKEEPTMRPRTYAIKDIQYNIITKYTIADDLRPKQSMASFFGVVPISGEAISSEKRESIEGKLNLL